MTLGIAALVLVLVKGSDWGWASARVLGASLAAALLLGGFVIHSKTSRSPLIHPELFRSRNFTGASVIAIFFSAGLGSMLYSLIIWEQQHWGWSALQSGLSIAPGPLMVPVMSFVFVAGLIKRFGQRVVSSVGSISFAVGVAWWALAIDVTPNYWTGVFGGIVLTGIGVGLTLPTLMQTAASSLPSHSFATGSAVVNMFRQTGLALGVAVTVAILGHEILAGPEALSVFRTAWWVCATMSLLAVVPAALILQSRHKGGAGARATEPAPVAPHAAALLADDAT